MSAIADTAKYLRLLLTGKSGPGERDFVTLCRGILKPVTKTLGAYMDTAGNFLNIVGTIGCGTGAGGAVTQASSITTAVTLDKVCGTITTVSSTLAAGVDAQFTLTNSKIAATDVVVVCVKSYGGTADGIPVAKVVATAAGSCVINVHNQGAVTLDALIVINFLVLKSVAA